MTHYQGVLDTYLEEEELITAQEYLERRKSGGVNPGAVEIIASAPGMPWGGFKVKLDTPRYCVRLSSENEE